MAIPFYTKTPTDDKYTIALDFADNIPTGRTVTSCTCSARKTRTEVDATSDILSNGTTATIATTVMKIVIAGGTVGNMYDVLFKLVLDDGQKVSGYARVFVDQ